MFKPLFAALLITLTGAASAQKMSPGLWEHAMTMKGGGGQTEAAMAQMQQQMATMPPEQRKMVEEMMAKQGIGIGGAGKPTTVRVCVSPAMAERDEMPQGDGRCKQDSLRRSGNKLSFKFSCSGDPPSSGEGEFTFSGSQAYSGHTVVNTTVKGKPERMEMQLEGRFVAADCGSLKPLR